MTALTKLNEGRLTKRHSVGWTGVVLIGANQAEVRCIIKDISSRGARLSVARPESLPERFHLKIPSGAKVFRCHIVWREGSMLGVEFVGTRPRWREA